MAKRKSGEERGSAEEEFLGGVEKEVNEMTKKKSVAAPDESELQKTAFVKLPDMPDRVLLPKSRKVRVCAGCGTEFVPTKGYRHCCSAECQKARIQAGSAKGAKVTKDIWAVEKMKTAVGDPDVKDALGV